MRQYIFDINKFELAKLLRNHYKYTAVAIDPNILVIKYICFVKSSLLQP